MLEHWPKLRIGAFLSPGDIFGQVGYIDLMQKLCSLFFDLFMGNDYLLCCVL